MSRMPIFEREVRAMSAASNRLAEDIARLIQVESVEDWEYGTRRGRLHAGSLYKIPSGGTDVFRRVNTPIITDDTALLFLGDASGSMSGEKFYALTASFVLLNKACEKIGATYEFDMFSENSEPCPLHIILKDFNRGITEDQIISRCGRVYEQMMGNNADGEALIWAYHRLMARPERNKILIVLSDGQPMTGAKGDAATHLKKVVSAIEEEIDVFAIGLMHGSVSEFYSNYCVIRHANELPDMFLNLLKSKVLGV